MHTTIDIKRTFRKLNKLMQNAISDIGNPISSNKPQKEFENELEKYTVSNSRLYEYFCRAYCELIEKEEKALYRPVFRDENGVLRDAYDCNNAMIYGW